MQPNIVLIVADDLGVGDVGYSGNRAVKTPTIDRLATDGMRLRRHYSNSPVCAPARAALLTGRYPHRTGVIDVREVRGLSRLSLGEKTLADRLRTHGYRTGLIGKWHLGGGRRAFLPTSRGFDEFTGFLGGLSDYWNYQLLHGEEQVAGDGKYLTDVLTDHAVDFIERHQDERFFLEVAYNAPHEPFQAPAELIDEYRDLPVSDEVRTLYAMVTAMDRGIGAVLDALERHGLTDDTIVVFTSDNGPDFSGGPQLAEVKPKLERYNAGLRGHKGLVFEGGVHVPCVLRWPGGGVRGGSVIDAPTQFVDWTPTLLELAGGAVNAASAEFDGRSIVVELTEPTASSDVRSFAAQWNRYEPVPRCNAAIWSGRWKLVWPALDGSMTALPEDSAEDRRLHRTGEYPLPLRYSADVERQVARPSAPLLFDLDADPSESTDVAEHHPDVVVSLVRELDEWFAGIEHERARVVDAGACV